MIMDVVIVGGGLSGLCTAISLAKKDINVLVIEKNGYPKHKVCGEYVSNEVLPFLNAIDFDPFDYKAKRIHKFLLSTQQGNKIASDLPLGGFSLSRYCFDKALVEKAKASGVNVVKDTVITVSFNEDVFKIKTIKGNTHTAQIAIGAYGKRSNLDKKFNRSFINKNAPYLAVKAHYKADFPEDLVALHNFEGGYCGLSKVENNHVNACYITDYKSFKKYKNVDDFQRNVLYKNPYLKAFFENAIPVFENPLTISQISFLDKRLIENHVLMSGDSASMIHPLCGNGMSMAIQSAQLLSKLVFDFFSGEITSRNELESTYLKLWNREFKARLKTGRFLAGVFRLNYASKLILTSLSLVPGIVPKIIARTHGKPIAIA